LSQACVFVGPTRLQKIPDRVHVFAPAALGSVFRAVEAGYRLICLIDGYFGNIPSVWHKEILFALHSGVAVWGASSMGALRAAELHAYGMVGFGWTYRAFRRGILQDDDEVCVLHAVSELDFAPLSEAMVNIRYSLRRLRRRGSIDAGAERRIVSALKALHFPQRDETAIRRAFEQEFGARGAAQYDRYECLKVDIKTVDADMMLDAVASFPMGHKRPEWAFPVTNHWLNQFMLQKGQVPQLCSWTPTYSPQ
jgi:hypothetical protein